MTYEQMLGRKLLVLKPKNFKMIFAQKCDKISKQAMFYQLFALNACSARVLLSNKFLVKVHKCLINLGKGPDFCLFTLTEILQVHNLWFFSNIFLLLTKISNP